MRKLALKVEELRVDSFSAGAASPARGTVHGHYTGLSRYTEYATCTQPTDVSVCGPSAGPLRCP
jgi:hypothetical protein